MAKILSQQIKPAEFCRNIWHVTPEAGVTPEDLGESKTWVNIAKQLSVSDRIEAVAVDGSWFAELFVRAVVGVDVKIVPLRVVQFEKAPKALAQPTPLQKDEDEYEIKFAGAAKWRGTRKSDGAVMIEGLVSREAVKTWLAENVTELV